MKQINLTGKLSLLVTFGIILSVGALGVYFDSFLKNNFLEDANKRMRYGFQHLASDLASVSQELQEGISFVRTDEQFLASIDLINNYQDKNDYNAALLDEEKKIIAEQLLSRVKLSLNHHIVLYDKNEELIAFVEDQGDKYHLDFVSYEKGKRILYRREKKKTPDEKQSDEDRKLYVKLPFPKKLPVDFHHQSYYAYASAEKGVITHHIRNGQILVTSHLSIFDTSGERVLMHIEMSHLFDDEYFKDLSGDLDLIIRYSADQKNTADARSLSEINTIKRLNIIHGKRAYFSTARMTTFDGDFFYHVALNKENLLVTLAKNRRQFLILIVIVVVLVLVLLRLVFSRTLIAPLELLMEQIRKIEKQDYSQSVPVKTDDELETISRNINKLAVTVREREDALLESQKTLEHLSHHDPLTDLPNRRLFMSRLEQAMQRNKNRGTRFAVFFLDLDEFKQVNDALGHDVGDQLLVEVSLRLAETIRSSDILARIGGDEFNILMEDIDNIRDVGVTAEKLLADFKVPFTCAGHELSTTVSIGIALYPENGTDTVTLIKHADMAMYQSKENGRDDYSFFSAELATHVKTRIDRINALKQALHDFEEFHLLYQPKICLRTGRVESMEALVRWQSASLGFMRPDQFIPLAEETNLIIPLGEWIINQAFRDFILFQQSGSPAQKICVNVSGVQLMNSDIFSTVQQAINRTGIRPEQIELEITEGSLATKEKKSLQALDRFREMHIDLAIDDFGTGYSSMSYLQQLPVTRLKIDKSFIDNLPDSEESCAVVQAIIALAKTFHLHITAEGVETEEQVDFLRTAGCDEIQGYFYAKPLSGEKFLTFSSAFTAEDLS